MGLSKTKTEFGQTVDYWVITRFPSDMIRREGFIELRGYPTRQMYKDHPNQANPSWAREIVRVPRQDFEPVYMASLDPAWTANLHEMMYAYVVGNPAPLPTRADGSQISGAAGSYFADATPVHEDA